MIRSYSFYHRETGRFAGKCYETDSPTHDTIAREAPEGHDYIEGRHDHLSKHVNIGTGLVEDWQPPAPSPDHEWDVARQRWKLNVAASLKLHRSLEATAQIQHLENDVQPRILREVALGRDGAKERLASLDAEIEQLRPQL